MTVTAHRHRCRQQRQQRRFPRCHSSFIAIRTSLATAEMITHCDAWGRVLKRDEKSAGSEPSPRPRRHWVGHRKGGLGAAHTQYIRAQAWSAKKTWRLQALPARKEDRTELSYFRALPPPLTPRWEGAGQDSALEPFPGAADAQAAGAAPQCEGRAREGWLHL
jgi:hypothetical protein